MEEVCFRVWRGEEEREGVTCDMLGSALGSGGGFGLGFRV